MRILLDCDGILADFHKVYLPIVHRFTGILLKEEDVVMFNVLKQIEKEKDDKDIKLHIQTTKACLNIPVIEGSKEAVKEIQKLGEVVIVTAPMNTATWCYERMQWLQDHFEIPKSKIVFAKNKHYISGDIFLDDSLDNCKKWNKYNKGKTLLWDRSWNRKDREIKENIEVINNWKRVVEICKLMKDQNEK